MMEAVRTSETSVDNHFTRQYIPEDNSEHHTRRRENLKSHHRPKSADFENNKARFFIKVRLIIVSERLIQTFDDGVYLLSSRLRSRSETTRSAPHVELTLDSSAVEI
jgi:hypothetical protein